MGMFKSKDGHPMVAHESPTPRPEETWLDEVREARRGPEDTRIATLPSETLEPSMERIFVREGEVSQAGGQELPTSQPEEDWTEFWEPRRRPEDTRIATLPSETFEPSMERVFVREDDVPGTTTPIFVTYIDLGVGWVRVSDLEAVVVTRLGASRWCVEAVMRSGNRYGTRTVRRRRDAVAEKDRLIKLVIGE